MGEDTATWPRGLKEIARLIGPKAAVALAERIGGVETYIPKNPGPDHYLAGIIGFDALVALGREFGGLHLLVPKGAYRDLKKVHVMNARGSRRAVALAVGVTERYVYKVLSGLRPDEDEEETSEPTLF